MNKTFIAAIVLALGLLPIMSNAAIIDVSGPLSNFDVPPAIITAPDNALNSDASNLGMEGFNEAQGVVTTVAHNIDAGDPIPAGTVVDSHMIFLNKPDDVVGTLSHAEVVWTFDGPIIGIMSDDNEIASTFELGAPSTNYPTTLFSARGIESGDSLSILDNTLTVTMTVSQPGDWIRVVTLASTPITELEIDIKPGSCPNPLNVKSKGVLPVAVLGTEVLDVIDIDVATVSLAGVSPIRFDYEDVATPFEGELCDCHEEGSDGYLDLTLKFDTQEIVTALGDVEDGEYLPLTLLVTLVDGTVIQGTDCVRIIEKGKD